MIYIYHLRDTLWVWDDWNVVENLTSTLSLVLRSVKVDSMRNKNEGSEICDYRKRNKKWFRDLWFKWHWNLSLSSPVTSLSRFIALYCGPLGLFKALLSQSQFLYTLCIQRPKTLPLIFVPLSFFLLNLFFSTLNLIKS